ncbi:MAG: HNH endonuclease [Actinomycetota bacterium]
MRERRQSRPSKHELIQRAGSLCEYCRTPLQYSQDPFAAEHIQPRRDGGRTESENLALSCHGWNGHKLCATHAPDPTTGVPIRLFHPRKDQWRQHFAWSEDSIHVIALTSIGRATIARLQLNRSGLLGLRRALVTIGAHPPEETE